MADRHPDIPGYAVEAELGRGGMGVVYRVRRRGDGRVLALKMILRGRGASFAELARFRIEAEALACLDHPNIVKIRDVGVHDGFPFIVLDFAERGSLKQAVRGPQQSACAAGLVRTLALALQHAHDRGMLHRDLKPANVLLTGDGTPVVTDFGLVKFSVGWVRLLGGGGGQDRTITIDSMFLDDELRRYAVEFAAQYPRRPNPLTSDPETFTQQAWDQCAARTGLLTDGTRLLAVREFLTEAERQSGQPDAEFDDLTRDGAVMGSPNYMAPEQAAGDLVLIGPRTDVYGLGGVLYELLTGVPPFRAPTVPELLVQVRSVPPTPPRALAPEVPADVEAVCLKCLEKLPGSRYQSAADLADDLARFADGRPTNALAEAARGGPPPTRESPAADGGSQPPPTRPVTTRSWWPFGRRSLPDGSDG